MDTDFVQFTYTNHRGETAVRRVQPLRIWWGVTVWHQKSQWFLEALDIDKKAKRDFALCDISGWAPYQTEE